jgi:hypothetical protein
MEFPRVISSSIREDFSRCPQKFFNSTILGIQPKGEEINVHLTAGGAYAAALESLRREYYTTGDYDKAIASGLEALIKSYGPHDPHEGETKTLDRTIAAYIEHLVRYPPATDHIKPSMGPNGPRVEFSFALELPFHHPVTNEPILFSGRFDQLADFNGALFIFDDKTTGSLSKYWRQQWDLRSQITGYVMGAQLLGYNVVGAILRGMAILKTKCDTQEAITHRPQWMIDRWKTRLFYDVERMLDMWYKGYWPHQGEENGACSTYGLCNYYALCTAAQPEHYIDVMYERKRWDPIDREMKESV